MLAAWNEFVSTAPAGVREFRLMLTLVALLIGSSMTFARQHLVDRERLRLVNTLQTLIENLKRLQNQFVQSEKLASLGQLAAGAAHEINNPLTAILDIPTCSPRNPLLVRVRVTSPKRFAIRRVARVNSSTIY